MRAGEIRGLQVTLSVTRVTRSVDFYRDTLGFEFRGYWDAVGRSVVRTWEGSEQPEYAEVYSGPYRLGLRAASEPVASASAELTLFVQDVDEIYERAHARLPEVTKPERQPWGARMFSFRDPDGYRWSFLEAPADGSDA